MSIASIPGVQFIEESSRCYTYALDFVVASAAVGAYLNVYHGQAAISFAPKVVGGNPQYPSAHFQGQASGRNLAIVPHEILESVLVRDTRMGRIPYLCPTTYQDVTGNSTGAVSEVLEGLAHAMFTRYYENQLALVEAAHGKRSKNGWPPVLQFSAVVRDAMSHGGKVHMFASVPAVTYFGLTYSAADNGRRVLHQDLTCADIFFLMLEMDTAF